MGQLQVVKDEGSTAKNHSTERRERERERLTTEMQHDEWLARRIQAAVDRNRPRANPEDERNAVRPRAMQQDDVQSNQTSAEVSGDRHRDQSGSGEMQVEDRAVQASAQGAKRLAEVVLQRDSGARHWSCNGPMPSGIDMNSIVTTEQCEQRVQSVLKELGEDSTGHRWDEGYVLDVTTMNLSDDLVSAVKEVTACMRIQKIPSHGMRSSSRSFFQAKSML